MTPGESYQAAACRGLHEELGLQLPADSVVCVVPAFLQDTRYVALGLWDREFVEIYAASSDAPLKQDDVEVWWWWWCEC